MANLDRDRHLTTEQLSAFLDAQLSPAEQAEFNAHIESCQRCQGALASLRQTVALLRAMPQPSLPRSFALPAGVTYLQEPAARQGEPTYTPARRRLPNYMRRSLRAMSTIAAVIGFIFLLSGILPMLTHSGGTMTTSAGSTTAPASPNNKAMQRNATATNNAPTPTPNKASTRAGSEPGSTPAAGSTPSVKMEPKKTSPNNQTPKQAPPVPPIIDLSIPLVRQALGFVLLVIGIIGVLLTRRWSPRRM
ncbi:MAG TPA: zf-HC2 domain-containing protein [Ktedonobacteraceae bacterium]